MNTTKLINALDAAKKMNYYLKIVVSTKYFDNYNNFFNIFYETEEPCRRIVVLTPYKDLEEVYDYSPGEDITPYTVIDGNLWIKEYPLIINPSNINMEEIYIPENIINRLMKK